LKFNNYKGNLLFRRTILAALHFNYNVKREPKVDDNGRPKLEVRYPKFKYGEATVRERKTPQNFGELEYLIATDYLHEVHVTIVL